MLGLLDQDEETVQGTLPILQALAALPLENLSTRRECLLQLEKLAHVSVSPSKALQVYDPRFDALSGIPTASGDGTEMDAMPPSFVYEYDDVPKSQPLRTTQASQVPPGNRTKGTESGRVKSLSLHHCKAFLLACANEIHELDSENPNFDYMEDTNTEPRTTHRGLLQLLDRRMYRVRRPGEYDYVSTAGSSSVSVATEADQDDVEANQGSEFSEVLRRADYLSDVGSNDDGDNDGSSETSWSMQVADKRHVGGSAPAVSGPLLQLKRHAFDALQQNGRRTTSQRRVFQRMKAHAQQMRLKRVAMAKLRLATTQSRRQTHQTHQRTTAHGTSVLSRAQLKLSQHLDLVFVVLCAALLQLLSS